MCEELVRIGSRGPAINSAANSSSHGLGCRSGTINEKRGRSFDQPRLLYVL
jgi:hypothetical protein